MRLRARLRRELSARLGRNMSPVLRGGPVISFTFDDFPASALETGGALLRRHGLRGTFYASLGLMGRAAPTGQIFERAALTKLLAEGHELGCHTFHHSHAWETPPADFRDSIIRNATTLAELIPGEKFTTFSYPISGPSPSNKRIAAKFFACSRGGGQVTNHGRCDLNLLNAFFLEKSRDDLAFIRETIALNVQVDGWLVFATHDISLEPTPFGITPALFNAVLECSIHSGAAILPVAEALIRKTLLGV